MRRTVIRLACAAMLVAAASSVAGCGDDGGLPDFDPLASQAALDGALAEFVEDNGGLESLAGLGDFISAIAGGDGGPSLSALGPAGSRDQPSGLGRRSTLRVMSALAGRRSVEAVGVAERIPVELLGATCVWDLELVNYLDDPGRTGAPPDGIRFILYTLEANDLPDPSLTEIGRIDIIDHSALPNVGISLETVEGGSPSVVYDVTGPTTPGIDVTMDGFLGAGADRLPFTFGASGDLANFSLTYRITADEFDADYAVALDFLGNVTIVSSFSDAASGTTVGFVLGFDSRRAVREGSGIAFEGREVGLYSGSSEELALTPAPGSPFSEEELNVLDQMSSTLDVFLLTLLELAEFGLNSAGASLLAH
jgi:hypothetical protein